LYLIEHGAEVNHRNNNGETALSRCTNYVQREYVLGPLIQAGAIE
jgi:ankyrin repeat protein